MGRLKKLRIEATKKANEALADRQKREIAAKLIEIDINIHFLFTLLETRIQNNGVILCRAPETQHATSNVASIVCHRRVISRK